MVSFFSFLSLIFLAATAAALVESLAKEGLVTYIMESKRKEAKISSGLAYISLCAAAEWSGGLRHPAVQVMMVAFIF